MHAGLTRSLVALLAAGTLVGIAACADPDDTTDAGTTVASLSTENVQTVPPTQPPTTVGVGGVSQVDTEYTVQAGDYLSGIAARYKVDVNELAAYNEWADGINHPLFPGMVIRIQPGFTVPGETTTTVASTDSTTAGSAGGGESTTAPPTTLDTSQGGTYVVVANDYLGGIAKKVGSTVDAIVAANGWADGANHVLIPGDEIKIP